MKMLRVASLASNFTGFNKKECSCCHRSGCLVTFRVESTIYIYIYIYMKG